MSKENIIKKWFEDNGDFTHRINYDLNSASIVFDIGGYEGTWSEKIYNKYNCNLYIFEPIKKYYDLIYNKFNKFNNIKIYNFGMSNKDEEIKIYHSNDCSSIYREFINFQDIENIKLKNFCKFLINENIKEINLIKINIEGCEYNLLDHIIQNNLHLNIKNIQVQFHDFIVDSKSRRNYIRENLKKSHKLTYDYEFVWENWQLK